MAVAPQITLVQDSREQCGYGTQGQFSGPFLVSGLAVGDYSVLGLKELIAIERKSLPDLLGSLTSGRDRFEAEMRRARHCHKFFLLVECSPKDFLVEDFGKLSRATPRSVWGTLMTWMTRYHPVIFGVNRQISARICEAILVAYAKEFFKRTDKISRAAAKIPII